MINSLYILYSFYENEYQVFDKKYVRASHKTRDLSQLRKNLNH